jgi:flagellar biosynthesis/type III secretory pathway chaperone
MSAERLAIDVLINEVERFPDLESRRTIKSRLESIQQRVDEALRAYRQAHLTVSAFKTLNPADPIPDITDHQAILIKTVRSLRRAVEEEKVTANSTNDQSWTQKIAEQAQKCERKLQDAWEMHFTEQIGAYQQLVHAGSSARLAEASALKVAVQRLKSATQSIPSTQEGISEIGVRVEEVRQAISKLGLTGRVGEFLTAAADVGASADSLLDPEVQQFLGAHPGVKSLLKIKLS